MFCRFSLYFVSFFVSFSFLARGLLHRAEEDERHKKWNPLRSCEVPRILVLFGACRAMRQTEITCSVFKETRYENQSKNKLWEVWKKSCCCQDPPSLSPKTLTQMHISLLHIDTCIPLYTLAICPQCFALLDTRVKIWKSYCIQCIWKRKKSWFYISFKIYFYLKMDHQTHNMRHRTV